MVYLVGAADPRTFRTLAPERAHNGISRARSVDRDRHVSRNYHNAERGVCAMIVDSTHACISHVTRISRSLSPIPFRSSTHRTQVPTGTPRVFSAPFVSSPHRERGAIVTTGISRSRGSLAGTREFGARHTCAYKEGTSERAGATMRAKGIEGTEL